MYTDFRAYLQTLKQEHQLLEIEEVCLPEPDLAAAARAITKLSDKAPALSFTNIKGYRSAHVVMNALGSWPNHALALGLPKNTPVKDQFFEFTKRYEQYPGEVKQVGKAPWQEVVVDKDIDLFQLLPLFRLNSNDGGFYIDKAVTVSRDPDDFDNDAKQNVGIYRMQVKGKSRIAIQPVPQHDIAIHLDKAERLGQDLPVAICISNEPVISLVGGMPILYEQSEYAMAAALQQAPYEVVKLPSGLDVPAGAEYIIEGKIISRKREIEGPFGEFTGHYSGSRAVPYIEVERVYYRKQPIFEHLYLGIPWTEIDYMIGINTCVPVFQQLKRDFPEVIAVNAMYTHGLVIIVSTKKRYGGFAKNVGLRTFSTPHGMGYAKIVIVVDEDIDPFNLPQVMWALSTKVNPAGDVIILPNLSVMPLDPGAEPEGITHKMLIDATTPVAPDVRGNYSQQLGDPVGTELWEKKLISLLNELQSNNHE